MPLSKIGVLNDFSEMSCIYQDGLKSLCVQAAKEALFNAGVSNDEISMIIVTSCTGFMMPSSTAFGLSPPR